MAALTALGAITIEARSVFGNKRVVIGTIVMGDGTNTWPSGGLALSPSRIGLGAIEWMQIEPKEMEYFYNKATGKIDAFVAVTAPGPAVIHVAAVAAVPTTAAVRFMAVGYGG